MSEYLLIDGTQIPVLSELAQVVGLNEAIVLQEVYYWCKVNKRERRPTYDGYYWVYNSYRDWHENHFPWWHYDTVRGIFSKLEKDGLLISSNFNKSKMDRTKWYRINFPVLAATIKSSPYGKNSLMDMGGITKPIPDIKTEVKVNGAFTPQAEKSTCFDCVENDTEEIDLQRFITWYCSEYVVTFGRKHPPLNTDQRSHIIANLANFLDDPEHWEVGDEGLRQMAKDFFYSVKSKDWHIFHFVDPEILKYRFLNVYRQGYGYC